MRISRSPGRGDTSGLQAGNRSALKRFHEFRRKHARFFGEVLRADPVVSQDGLVSLLEESIYFLSQVFLRRVELLPIRKLQILFRGCDVLGRAFFRRFQVAGRELWRNLRRRRLCRRRFGCSSEVLTGGGASGGGMGEVSSGGGVLTDGGAARTMCLLAQPAMPAQTAHSSARSWVVRITNSSRRRRLGPEDG
jgi:hypothetical protein